MTFYILLSCVFTLFQMFPLMFKPREILFKVTVCFIRSTISGVISLYPLLPLLVLTPFVTIVVFLTHDGA